MFSALADHNIDVLEKLPIAHGAQFGSYMDQHEDECLPGTRVDLLREVENWAKLSNGRCIFWLSGMAGTGKSTISRTVAREEDRGNSMKLFPTIARQLARHFPELDVRETIRADPDIATKSLKEQFDKLIHQPFVRLPIPETKLTTGVIIIDALDECERDDEISIILGLLPKLQEVRTINLRVFLTSRPDLPVRLGFSKIKDYQYIALHDMPVASTEYDISLFFNHHLQNIRIDQELPDDWPGPESLRRLVKLSVPLFIFAATVCRIFKDPQWDPTDSLATIFAGTEGSKFDKTYLPVLNRVLVNQSGKEKLNLIQDYRKILGAVVMLESPLSVSAISKLLDLSERLINRRLGTFQSVIYKPEDKRLPVSTFHLSFRDFLIDIETREKSPLWVDAKEIHQYLAARCFSVLEGLRRNICGLPNDGTLSVKIDGECISPELRYACRFWTQHLLHGNEPKLLFPTAFSFIQRHLIHWVEAMSILNTLSDAVRMIEAFQKVVNQGHMDTRSLKFLNDARLFIIKNSQIAQLAPLQLYSSALLFTPTSSSIRETFNNDLPSYIKTSAVIQHSSGAELLTLEGHTGPISSVAFSFDNQLVASSSEDCTVRLWNSHTGALYLTLVGHSKAVLSVTFSSEKQLLASGSADKTIRLWDTVTGATQKILLGHLWSVTSVAFSPDEVLLVSGSIDMTFRIWNVTDGSLRTTVNCPTGVASVLFYPDSVQVVCCLLGDAAIPNRKKVFLWDIATEKVTDLSERLYACNSCMTFSAAGELLIVSSRYIKDQVSNHQVWNLTRGVMEWSFKSESKYTMEGGYSRVTSMAFSPRSRLSAVGSSHGIVELETPAGCTTTLTASGDNVGAVKCVSFSHHGLFLACGSHDYKVRLWDSTMSQSTQTSDSHVRPPRPILSMEFSPDGHLLASRSRHNTISIWDSNTSAVCHEIHTCPKPILLSFLSGGRVCVKQSCENEEFTQDPAIRQMRHSWSKLKPASHMLFSPNSQFLAIRKEENIIIILEVATGRFVVSSLKADEDIPICESTSVDTTRVSLVSGWVMVDGEKSLWLPREYRIGCSAARGNSLATIHASGRVFFIEFHL
ncbi:NACHT and WD40 domain protein [Penicillium canariense]|uniref:NACHT and WD40 domain protein n=1 Tax=Penicillium canariense TaxID=189055 RepID=A0A9W9I415_9EURO|nr:NACHT and WD40 domain protein [Penicillium canariense]KAJ5166258.1 NACHT and WD40 domain protein [Penicillium canariense]